jgi:TRAP-type C4-dicarboxylate transport system substrate-binding protein
MRHKFSNTSIIGILFLTFFFAYPSFNQAKSAEVTLRMHSFIPPVANPAKTWLIPWAKKIGKASNGRIKVQPFWAMGLGGKPPQLLSQVKDGVVDIVWTLTGFTAGRMPKVEAFELPFVHRNALSTTLALQDYQDKHLVKDEFKDYKILLLHAHDGAFFMTKGPIKSVADLKGMKLRVHNRLGVWLLESLGVAGIATPLMRIPPMLSKGVIEGSVLPYEIAPAVKMHELVSHFTMLSGDAPRLSTAVFSFLMNKKSYAKLPADLKKVIDDNSGRNIARAAGENWRAIEKPAEKLMRSKSKNKFHVLSAEESAKIKSKAGGVIERWYKEIAKKGHDGPKLLQDAYDMIAKYEK